MRVRHPHQRGAEGGGLIGVDRDPGAAAADLLGIDVEDAPFAADHDRQPGIERGAVGERAGDRAAVVAVQQFDVLRHRVGDAGGFGGAGIGGVGEIEGAVGAPGPDRPGRGEGEVAQHLGLFLQRLVALGHLGEFAAQAAQFADPHDGLAADRAAHRLDAAAAGGDEMEQEAFAGFQQRVDRVVHPQRRLGRHPGSEGEHPLRLQRRILRQRRGRDQQRDVAADLRTVVAGGPGDQHLRLGEQQRAEPVGFDLQALDVAAQPRLAGGGAQPGAHQQDGGEHREAEHAGGGASARPIPDG